MARTSLLAAALLICTVAAAHTHAHKTVTGPGAIETTTARIEKIDVPNRFVVLRGDDGADVGVFAPPALSRFHELRVGDRVTIAYYESTMFQLKRRGSAAPPVSEEAGAVESQSKLPSAAFSHQSTERVTVKRVDPTASLITVVGRDGRTIRRHVENPLDLEGVKKADHIDITYTQAVLASITRAK